MNPFGQILIALRDQSLHQGGLWEFPGGKVEASESIEQALVRELKEELDINVRAASPLITINYQYPDLSVQLCVYRVDRFEGVAKGCAGQPIRWVEPEHLPDFAFPVANQPIITAAQLPSCYAILDDAQPEYLLLNLRKLLQSGIKLIQARLKRLTLAELQRFLKIAYPLCKQNKALLLLNSAVHSAEQFAVDGLHLTSADLRTRRVRSDKLRWLAASCHDLAELQHAQQIGVDFAVLAPVLPTPTHPDAKVLGWQQFTELVSQINLPVYALGGMTNGDLITAQRSGGQGIAAVRAFLG